MAPRTAPFTQAVLKAVLAQQAPWQRCWPVGNTQPLPVDAQGQRYKGADLCYLLMQNASSRQWMTYPQAQSLGGQVRRGESGLVLPQKHAGLRVQVFNRSQIEGLPRDRRNAPELNPGQRVEALRHACGVSVQHLNTGVLHYDRRLDAVFLPERRRFASASHYYATLLHGLARCTAHPRRLNRPDGAADVGAFLSAAFAALVLGVEWQLGYCPVPDSPSHHRMHTWLNHRPEAWYQMCQAAEAIVAFWSESLARPKEKPSLRAGVLIP